MLSRSWEYLHRADTLFLKQLYLTTTEKTVSTKCSAIFWQSLICKCLNSAASMGFQQVGCFFFFSRNLNNISQRGCVTVARMERFNLERPCTAKDQINFLASVLAAKLSVLHCLHGRGLNGSKKIIFTLSIKTSSLLLDLWDDFFFCLYLLIIGGNLTSSCSAMFTM